MTPLSTSKPAQKLRSCNTCRSRKVKCDKQSPCSNCRRAKIACVFPPTDRPPRWAERLNRSAAASDTPAPQDADISVDKVIDRLRNVENLVKDLRGELEQAHATAGISAGGVGLTEVNSAASSIQNSDAERRIDTPSAAHISSVQDQFGRLVLPNTSGSRYVSSGFWSRINDELDELKKEARGLLEPEDESSEDEASPSKPLATQELQRTHSERHAFLFGHNLSPSAPNLHDFHPLPSQIPFLLDVYSKNVNFLCQIVHVPTIARMIYDVRGNVVTSFTPANEALMFSIYYAAITSMEEDDVMVNFGSSKNSLGLKYRLGLEHALAIADFINVADIVLVQAFTIFLFLVRRHDSPKFVWMMTGLAIRMAQYLGLQRDGTHFEQLTPFEIEMRRRVWGALVMLDMRASEDQGTDLTIASGSFDAKAPLNINDADINPETRNMPVERDGVTDMSFARICIGLCDVMRQLMAPIVRNETAGLEEKSRMLNEIYQRWEQGYLQYTTASENILYWVAVNVARITMAKMTLIVFLPVLFSSPSKDFSDEIRIKLLVSAIEVAEYNHALNADQAGRQWRWIYQTYTHWHAIVYLAIELSRRPWSPIVERGWIALHSIWLIPAQTSMDEKTRMWVPLRKLMAEARKHREAELNRLRGDPQAAARLEMEDRRIPVPSSSGLFPGGGSSVDRFRDRWRQLVTMPEGSGDGTTRTSGVSGASFVEPSTRTTRTGQQTARPIPARRPSDSGSDMSFGPTYPSTDEQLLAGADPLADPAAGVFSNLDMDAGDIDMNLGTGDVNWYDWVESARGMESEGRPGGSGGRP